MATRGSAAKRHLPGQQRQTTGDLRDGRTAARAGPAIVEVDAIHDLADCSPPLGLFHDTIDCRLENLEPIARFLPHLARALERQVDEQLVVVGDFHLQSSDDCATAAAQAAASPALMRRKSETRDR